MGSEKGVHPFYLLAHARPISPDPVVKEFIVMRVVGGLVRRIYEHVSSSLPCRTGYGAGARRTRKNNLLISSFLRYVGRYDDKVKALP